MIAEIAAANAAFASHQVCDTRTQERLLLRVRLLSTTSLRQVRSKKKSKKHAESRKRSDLEEFLALEQLRKQEQELKELLIYQGRPGMWDDFQAFRVKARQQTERQQEREKIRAETTRREGPQERNS
jgi:hypothetical protein